ncbi:hypothetical protein [Pseudoduganella namucuonensis]|uniref:hypothetical protein n=1 Tax=Pseudoduganella namucuonensis TaxID=1035707 RepID=UPI001160D63C|nr:hypothetical protein [Pseudoduganella namucuonensis]
MAILNGDNNSPPDKLRELLLLNLERIDAAVDGEYAENDRRLNWFLLFQAFLFQGYATALQAIIGGGDKDEGQLAHAMLLMVVILAVGLITSCMTHVSTQAGILATEMLKQLREDKFRRDAEALNILTDGWFSKSDPQRLHDKGLLPTRWGPRLIFIAWIVVALHYTWIFCC